MSIFVRLLALLSHKCHKSLVHVITCHVRCHVIMTPGAGQSYAQYLRNSEGVGWSGGSDPPTFLNFAIILEVTYKNKNCSNRFSDASLWYLHWPMPCCQAVQTSDSRHWPVWTWGALLSPWTGCYLHSKTPEYPPSVNRNWCHTFYLVPLNMLTTP